MARAPHRAWSPPALLRRAVDLRPGEVAPVLWAFAQFFLLLSSLYVVRPLRDEMGILADVEHLQWLFTGTFVGMLVIVPVYGWGVARLGRRVLVPAVYVAIAVTMVGIHGLAAVLPDSASTWLARFGFVWLSLYNLLAVSVFWSLMADSFSSAQGKRLFGFVAAGGSAGALVGPAASAVIVQLVEPMALLWVAAVMLVGSAACARRVEANVPEASGQAVDPIGGTLWAGFRLLIRTPMLRGISVYVLAMTWISTILYFEQAHIVDATISDSSTRTTLFAGMDLAVNVLAVTTQALLTGRLIRWVGLAAVLVALPVVSLAASSAMAVAPVLGVLVVVQVLRRATNFALSRPAREVLYTAVSREARFKGKNVVDTVVYRGGDALAGWAFAGLRSIGLGLGSIAWTAVPIALLWAWVGARLGRGVDQRADA